MATPPRRRARFRRDADNLGGLRLTERDREILRRVARHRFLRSSHLVDLVPGSAQQILRRLGLLFHHGFLDRPGAQLEALRYRAGSKPIVYGLGSRGASLLRRECDVPFARLDWSAKNRGLKRLFLEHALMVADFMVSLELACRDGGIRLIGIDGEPVGADSLPFEPLSWRVELANGQKIGVVPDAAFGLEHPGGERAFYFLEADRGTMPVVRRSTDQSSISRKLHAYAATWDQGVHHQLGIPRFRVLTLTGSSNRVEAMLGAAATIRFGRGVFRFGAADSEGGIADPLTFLWRSAATGQSESLRDTA